jgi:hypothetical protein
MDAFVTRKKRKCSDSSLSVSAQETPQVLTHQSNQSNNEESTDVKLAILSSLHPTIDQETLLDILLAHDGEVEATSRTLKARLPKKPGTGSTVAAQSSLRSFAVNSAGPESPSQSKRAKLLSRKGATLHLYDPVDISEHTPCTIIHNFLPAEEANSLLKELLKESESFEKITFKLFDNVVSSPHTSSFYVGSYEEMQEQKYEYVYNGSRLTVSLFCRARLRMCANTNTGRQNSNTTARAGQGARTGGRQPRDPGAYPDSLWREEAQVPVSKTMDSQRGLCELLQRAPGECRLGMFTLPPYLTLVHYQFLETNSSSSTATTSLT